MYKSFKFLKLLNNTLFLFIIQKKPQNNSWLQSNIKETIQISYSF